MDYRVVVLDAVYQHGAERVVRRRAVIDVRRLQAWAACGGLHPALDVGRQLISLVRGAAEGDLVAPPHSVGNTRINARS